ncbi:NAD(P)H-dependent oxidoreductase [Klenkia taihuensis]|uniref:NAD(P)H dehydrogenase (Quinone) n=1 Tax=Klenkia taihuensis TaxID=1225127 RepID=A0A1I1NUW1_9ACTN|nr:NAD(P)H-dependent oxidoreductase [Klenkia taihuensis]GHE11679.1 NAD(P)H dehydrogenase [Klenkia taihuensis]SFD01451.1 NAD(P)H dehydrogenase (quinone) [Klenkia taihuensis]
MAVPRTLVVTAHPDPDSLTHRAAAELVARLGPGTATAHLAQEGFDPAFGLADHLTYRGLEPAPAEVRAEQRRIDAADHVVLVFPVHWWSFPALLKGWVDRVLITGWAFDAAADGRVVGCLQDRTLHLLPIAGATAGAWAGRGYDRAFATQVEVGIAGFCGMPMGVTAFVHDSDGGDPDLLAAAVQDAAAAIASAIHGSGARGT